MTIHATKTTAIASALALTLFIGIPAARSEVGACGPEPSASGANELHGTLYSIDGKSRSEADLPPALQQALFDARLEHYKKQRELIDAAVFEDELERRAKRAGKSQEQIASEVLAVENPDDASVEAFYNENKSRIAYPLDAVRDQIRQMLVQRTVQARQSELIAQAKRERSFKLVLAKPTAPYAEIATEGFPSKGASDAKVTIVEFADYQCPHCKRAAGAMDQIVKRYGDDVRVVFLDFPINPSGISRIIAEGGACAAKQGRFWAYHDLAFDKQSTLGKESATMFASQVGIDADVFQSCMDSSFPREQVAKAEAEARRLGLRSTPTFFLNGRRLHLHDFEKELPVEIDKALSAGSKS